MFEAGFVLGEVGLDVLLAEESQKPTAKFLLLVARSWFRGIDFKAKWVRIAHEKCVAHSVTQLVVNEIHKNWKKQSGFVRHWDSWWSDLTTVAERVKISTCSLLVLDFKLRTFDTCVRGCGLGEEKLSSCVCFLFTQARFKLEAGFFMVQRLRCSERAIFPKARLGKQQLEM